MSVTSQFVFDGARDVLDVLVINVFSIIINARYSSLLLLASLVIDSKHIEHCCQRCDISSLMMLLLQIKIEKVS